MQRLGPNSIDARWYGANSAGRTAFDFQFLLAGGEGAAPAGPLGPTQAAHVYSGPRAEGAATGRGRKRRGAHEEDGVARGGGGGSGADFCFALFFQWSRVPRTR